MDQYANQARKSIFGQFDPSTLTQHSGVVGEEPGMERYN